MYIFSHAKVCLVHDIQSLHKSVLIVQDYSPVLCIKLLLCRFKSQSRTSCMCLPSSLQPDAPLQANETRINGLATLASHVLATYRNTWRDVQRSLLQQPSWATAMAAPHGCILLARLTALGRHTSQQNQQQHSP